MFKPFCRRASRPSPEPGRRPGLFRPQLESLEDKSVPSAGSLTSVFQASGPSSSNYDADTASSLNGQSVVVYTHQFSSTDTDIYAQLYDTQGGKVGGEIPIAVSTRLESHPRVAMDNSGFFVVVWTDQFGPGDRDIMAARYDSSGNLRGSAITVSFLSDDEFDPDVAMDIGGSTGGLGNFVVTWTRNFLNSGDLDVRYAMYDDLGNQTLAPTDVAASGTFDEDQPSVARSESGNFGIAYRRSTNGTHSDVLFRRYDNSGTFVNAFTIGGDTTHDESRPSVAMAVNNSYVIAYQYQFGSGDSDIYAKRFTPGSGLSAAIPVQTSTNNEILPSVAVTRDTGSFAVAFERTNGTRGIFVTEFNAANTNLGTLTATSSTTAGGPSISVGGGEIYQIIWDDAFGGTNSQVYARRGSLP
jgi:hypothetical protein